jgi:hypothetical protein
MIILSAAEVKYDLMIIMYAYHHRKLPLERLRGREVIMLVTYAGQIIRGM